MMIGTRELQMPEEKLGSKSKMGILLGSLPGGVCGRSWRAFLPRLGLEIGVRGRTLKDWAYWGNLCTYYG